MSDRPAHETDTASEATAVPATTQTNAGIDARRGRLVMAVLHPSVQSPLPKIAPLLIAALEDAGWQVTQTYWGGRRARESWLVKVASRSGELALALARLAARRDAVLFVNSAHSWRGIARDVPLVLGARLLGHGTVVLWHGSDPGSAGKSVRSPFAVGSALLARCADAVLVLSSAELTRWREALPRARFFQVSNPYVARMSSAARGDDGACDILFVGRLMRAKGVFELLEAFARLRARHPCTLTIVGDGPDAQAVAEWVADRHLTAEVLMPGYLEEPDLRQRYASADVFVLPSFAEGFPTVLSEAMDAGLPVVTTACGGMADHLEEGVNCLFVRAGDAVELEDAIDMLLQSPALRASMSAANRLKVRSFAPEVVVRQYVRALEYVTRAR